MLGNFGMTDLPNFVTFDDSTVATPLLPTVSSMSVSAGTPSDTVSKVNPMPEPTNSTYTMGSTGNFSEGNTAIDIPSMVGLRKRRSGPTLERSAEWNKPSYNYQRTKRAEGTNGTTAGIMAGVALFGIGLWGVSQLIETDFDGSGLLTGRSSTTP